MNIWLKGNRKSKFTLALGLGFASIYFVTDPARGISKVKKPCLLLARKTLQLDDFANFMTRVQGAHPTRVSDAVQMLHEIQEDRNISHSMIVKDSLIIVSEIEPTLLSILKRLKLRGFANLLIVLGGSRSAELDTPFRKLLDTFQDALVFS